MTPQLTHSEHGLRYPRSGEVCLCQLLCLPGRTQGFPHWRWRGAGAGGSSPWRRWHHGLVSAGTLQAVLVEPCSRAQRCGRNSVPSWRRCSVLNTSAFHHLSGLGGPRVSLAEHRSVQTLWHAHQPSADTLRTLKCHSLTLVRELQWSLKHHGLWWEFMHSVQM